MSTISILITSYKFNRTRTLTTLEEIEKLADPAAALAFRLGPGRAHIAWQLMHVAVTEEIFATERLRPERPSKWTDLWPRFRGGSKADDDVPAPAFIRQVLEESRASLLETLETFSDDQLRDIPPALAERGWSLRDVLHIISWHESHHQGQAHAMLNSFRASQL
ncbi:MAG: DinB family protein [Planctomycetota bacterium]|nr:MAG: DinB family protein [Planctomycetota bacterium]